MYLKKLARKALNKAGFDIVRYRPIADPAVRRNKLLETYNVNTVLDVGANVGKFGIELRENGFDGKIISFEPLSSAYEELKEQTEKDHKWEAVNTALGDRNEISEINIAGNSLSSSIREMLPTHEKTAPEAQYVGKEKIEVRKLDSVFEEFCSVRDNILLKIDTQGFEKKVIDGARESLEAIDTVQLEMSLTPLYENETLFLEMIRYLNGKGYSLVHLEHVFSDRETGRLLQVDGMFHRFNNEVGSRSQT
jgi:FkbM family methyltransferase